MDLKVLNRLPGTMWDGLDFDQAPEQGVSPFPYLSVNQLLASSRSAWAKCHEALAAVPPLDAGRKSDGFDLGFSDLRRCSTADQSGLPDFEGFPDGY